MFIYKMILVLIIVFLLFVQQLTSGNINKHVSGMFDVVDDLTDDLEECKRQVISTCTADFCNCGDVK